MQEILLKTEGEGTCFWKFRNVPQSDGDEESLGGDMRIHCHKIIHAERQLRNPEELRS